MFHMAKKNTVKHLTVLCILVGLSMNLLAGCNTQEQSSSGSSKESQSASPAANSSSLATNSEASSTPAEQSGFAHDPNLSEPGT